MSPTDADPCPECGATVVPIVHGLPSPELFETAERGEVALGGCTVFGGQAQRACSRCGWADGPRQLQDLFAILRARQESGSG